MIDKKELIKLIAKLIREDDEIKGAIITALSGVVATKEDIARLIEHSNRRFGETNKRFEEMNKHFEDINKRFEEINKRFEEINKRFEDINKRFEEINKRFEEAAEERKALQDSTYVIRTVLGELIEKVSFLEKDIKNGNKEILDYLKKQFEN
ncbi:MAG: hypothetical protein ACTSQP_10310 [Promethearchaeota archaeon]